ncbi:MAG: superoxide dismutase, Cu-Zn family [Miltoncostaeaceae bacterium]|jgi:Cu-Zn family superoxide dismutase|nr:superoxide dismutase, Cu-Zn family [Miltoncostaeaceae bacterium]
MARVRRGRAAIAAVAAGTLAAGVAGGLATAQGAAPTTASAVLRDTSGHIVGTVNFEAHGGHLMVRVDATGLTPGFHGLHLHTVGKCEPVSTGADGATGAFLSAGGHMANPGETHGGHAGDLPALRVAGNGTATQTATTDAVTIAGLLAEDGTAVMVHAGPDNLANIPTRYTSGGAPGPDADTLKTGDSGGRVACGVVQAGAIAPGLPPSYRIAGPEVFPEGIAAAGRTFYVSSTSDGTIFRGSVGDEDMTPFLVGGADGRSTAIGVAVDAKRHRLFIAGGATGRIWAYDTRDGDLIARFGTGKGGFLNDVAVAPDGTAYVTDSLRPVLFRVGARELRSGGTTETRLASFMRLTPGLPYKKGFNVNGIEVGNRGRALVLAQSNTGRLFRIDLRGGAIDRIDLGAARLTNADGLVLRGRTLYAVRNADEAIAKVRLSADLRSGSLVGSTTHPSFAFPTTADLAGGRLLVVNSQFDRREAEPGPTLPFTVSAISPP